MIRHIVAWKFKEYAGGASAMENAMELKKQLEALRRGNLPGVGVYECAAELPKRRNGRGDRAYNL